MEDDLGRRFFEDAESTRAAEDLALSSSRPGACDGGLRSLGGRQGEVSRWRHRWRCGCDRSICRRKHRRRCKRRRCRHRHHCRVWHKDGDGCRARRRGDEVGHTRLVECRHRRGLRRSRRRKRAELGARLGDPVGARVVGRWVRKQNVAHRRRVVGRLHGVKERTVVAHTRWRAGARIERPRVRST